MIDGYTIRNELTAEQFDQLHELSQKMWWSAGRTKEEMAIMLEHCISFAVIHNGTERLIGFARVLTDGVRYAYIYDVMIEEPLRGNGLGKMIMQTILSHPNLSLIKYFELTCAPEMVNYYKMHGFNEDFGCVVSMRKMR